MFRVCQAKANIHTDRQVGKLRTQRMHLLTDDRSKHRALLLHFFSLFFTAWWKSKFHTSTIYYSLPFPSPTAMSLNSGLFSPPFPVLSYSPTSSATPSNNSQSARHQLDSALLPALSDCLFVSACFREPHKDDSDSARESKQNVQLVKHWEKKKTGTGQESVGDGNI